MVDTSFISVSWPKNLVGGLPLPRQPYLCPVRPTVGPSILLLKKNDFDPCDVLDG